VYHVLVVDDEALIREGIIASIDWQAIDCRVAGEADNGASALEMIERVRPDIVICDIRMPGVDGVRVAETIKERNDEMKIIFVTGHDEFVYAREALRNRVFDYILKPVDGELLRKAVESAKQSLEQTRKAKEEAERFKQALEANKPAWRAAFIRQLLTGGRFDAAEIVEKIGFFGLKSEYYQVILLEIDKAAGAGRHGSEYERQFLFYSVREAIAGRLRHDGASYMEEIEESRFLCLLCMARPLDTLTVLEQASELCRRQYDGISLSCGLSDVYTDLSASHHAYKQALQALSNKFYLGNGSIIPYRELSEQIRPAQAADSYSAGIRTVLRRWTEYADGQAEAELRRLLIAVIGHPDRAGADIHRSKCSAVEFVVCLLREFEAIGIEGFRIAADERAYARLLEAETLDDLVNAFGELVGRIVRWNESKRSSHYHLVVEKAVDFIVTHFAEEISLNDVATVVHMNASYLSRVIKKVTGANFVDILLKTRIERAKAHLKQPELKTYEIAAMVGIPDSKYFSSVFKKEVGQTPTEYRNNLPKENVNITQNF